MPWTINWKFCIFKVIFNSINKLAPWKVATECRMKSNKAKGYITSNRKLSLMSAPRQRPYYIYWTADIDEPSCLCPELLSRRCWRKWELHWHNSACYNHYWYCLIKSQFAYSDLWHLAFFWKALHNVLLLRDCFIKFFSSN